MMGAVGLPWDDGLITRRTVTVAPTVLPISVDDFRDAELRSPNGGEDDSIERKLWAAVSMAEHTTFRAISPQTSRLTLSGFPTCHIELDRPPIIEVESLQYYDENGDLQTLDEDVYRVTAESGPMAGKGRVDLVDGESWPSTATRPDAVQVTYRHGYVAPDSPDTIDVPKDLQAAIELIAQELYKQRSLSVQMPNSTPAILQAERIMQPYVVHA